MTSALDDSDWWDDDPDLQPVYLLDGIPMGDVDQYGCWWVVRTTKGWHDPVELRNQRTDIPNGPGAVEGIAWPGARLFSLNVTVVCPNLRARILARDRFAAMCPDPARLYELRVTDQLRRVRTASVRRDGKAPLETMGERRFDFSLPLVAPDPRRYDQWQEPLTNPPGAAPLADGLDFDAERGLDFDADRGANFYDVALSRTVARTQVGNYGTAPTAPVLRLTGPQSSIEVLHLESGNRLRYDAPIAVGERVWINCDRHPAKGLQGRECWSSLRGDVRPLVSMSGVEWFVVDPQATATFQLIATGNAESELQTSLRSAYY